MGMDIIFLQMGILMKEIGKMGRLMDKVFLSIIMEIFMKENLRMALDMDMENYLIKSKAIQQNAIGLMD